MNIKFNRIKISNFLSIGETDIDLEDKGFVLVKGVNNNTEDVALSNGSGKSTIFEAIIWCLCGETLRGSKNVTNIFGNDGAVVELYFNIDNDSYYIIRSKDNSKYKTTLKLFVNEKDISGKGIRDTEKILSETLPELTASFIGSVIILGQGMPQKFTNNSPSGRKEVLEKLSKSDFMIEDLKKRVSERKITLQQQLRKHEDNLLSLKSKLETQRNVALETVNKIESLESKEIYEKKLKQFNDLLTEKIYERDNKEKQEEYECIKQNLDNLSTEHSRIQQDLYVKIQEITDKYNAELKTINEEILNITSKKNSLDKYINDVENMVDICPTCHQRIENVVKPDITKEKSEKDILVNKLNILEQNKKSLTELFENNKNSLEQASFYKLEETKQEIKKKKQLMSDYEISRNQLNESIKAIEKEIEECKYFINTLDVKRQTLQQTIDECKIVENELCTQIHEEDLLGQDTQEHLNVINKFDTMLKRDFRGYLLHNVISYIDKRAKSYTKDIFDTQNIEFKLEGNNIMITFQGKDYENLSGGEKQKVDLIIQFSIRDMLSEYMNFSSSIIVLDEIFDNLDSIGCEKVINMINKRFTDINSIFIISHHAEELNIPVDSYITVIKNIKGVSGVLQ